MYANDSSQAFVVRVAGSRNEKSNLYIEGRSETPARSHRRTEQRDIATVQCRFRGARQLSAMLQTHTCQNKMLFTQPESVFSSKMFLADRPPKRFRGFCSLTLTLTTYNGSIHTSTNFTKHMCTALGPPVPSRPVALRRF